jgi:hypothetical protein
LSKATVSGRSVTVAHTRIDMTIVPAVSARNEEAVKGDWVEIVVDAGGEPRTYEVSATRAGRRVEVSIVRNVVTVSEVTRGGSVARTARFMANRVLALVEHPATRSLMPDDLKPGS